MKILYTSPNKEWIISKQENKFSEFFGVASYRVLYPNTKEMGIEMPLILGMYIGRELLVNVWHICM